MISVVCGSSLAMEKNFSCLSVHQKQRGNNLSLWKREFRKSLAMVSYKILQLLAQIVQSRLVLFQTVVKLHNSNMRNIIKNSIVSIKALVRHECTPTTLYVMPRKRLSSLDYTTLLEEVVQQIHFHLHKWQYLNRVRSWLHLMFLLQLSPLAQATLRKASMKKLYQIALLCRVLMAPHHLKDHRENILFKNNSKICW
jgi:hypothetical protein